MGLCMHEKGVFMFIFVLFFVRATGYSYGATTLNGSTILQLLVLF